MLGTVPSPISLHVTFSGSRTRIVQWPSRLVFRTTPRLNLSLLAATQTWTSLRQPLLRLLDALVTSALLSAGLLSKTNLLSLGALPRLLLLRRSLHNHGWRFFRHCDRTHHLRPRVLDVVAVLTVQLNVPFLNASATAFRLRVDGFDDETRCINLFASNTVVLGPSVCSTTHLGAFTLGRQTPLGAAMVDATQTQCGARFWQGDGCVRCWHRCCSGRRVVGVSGISFVSILDPTIDGNVVPVQAAAPHADGTRPGNRSCLASSQCSCD